MFGARRHYAFNVFGAQKLWGALQDSYSLRSGFQTSAITLDPRLPHNGSFKLRPWNLSTGKCENSEVLRKTFSRQRSIQESYHDAGSNLAYVHGIAEKAGKHFQVAKTVHLQDPWSRELVPVRAFRQ